MKNSWFGILGLVAGCAGTAGQPAAKAVESQGAEQTVAQTEAASQPTEMTDKSDQGSAAQAAAKPGDEDSTASSAKSSGGCTPLPNAEPKVATGEDMASDLGDTGRTFILNVAGVSVELPPCTPGADTEVLELSWETQERPTSSHVHPDFERHGATVRMPFPIKAAEGAPLKLRFSSHRELTKAGHKFVAAVEFSGECEGRFKRDPMEFGGCSHWQLFDAPYSDALKEMVAEVPETGGYRIQFGWMPKGK